MKLPFSIADCRLPIADCSSNRKSQIANRKSVGMALVITLILLSVTLVMALAFLAISRRERASVSTETDATTARLAADAALAHAEAQIIANLLVSSNAYNFGLIVSTNFINTDGFFAGAGGNLTNVSYNYANGNFVNADDFVQTIANLFYSPRVPVFIITNSQTGAADFRYYLDLNRNGFFDESGAVTNVDKDGNGLNPPKIFETGDPQWIGILARPDTRHSADNFFLSRYAFAAIPVGNTMDINYIHNNARRQNSTDDGFFRNQSVGTWEINLAAFLADLNTNEWFVDPVSSVSEYIYDPMSGGFISQRRAFDDALALLNYRYNTSYAQLTAGKFYFPNYLNDAPYNVDLFSDGPLQTTLNTNAAFLFDDYNQPWPGSENLFSGKHYFDLTADLFKVPSFAADMNTVTTNTFGGFTNSTYDRYTFYRLLDQLGTDSEPETDKINLNYSNAVVQYNPVTGVVTNIEIIPNAETNMVPWAASNFFIVAADKLLRTYTAEWLTNYAVDVNGYYTTNNPDFVAMFNVTNAFGITNIPVWVSNKFVYTSAVNRLLQLAANMYDSTTTNFYPSVFRPTFYSVLENGFTNVYINGYEQIPSVVPNSFGASPLTTPVDVESLSPGGSAVIYKNVNVYGVPWIIGAKKGFPNFNEFSMNTVLQVTRKIRIGKDSSGKLAFTNQMYNFHINNAIGLEFWNSYTNAYPNDVQVFVQNTNLMEIIEPGNLQPLIWSNSYTISTSPFATISPWQGTTWLQGSAWASGGMDSVTQPFFIPVRVNTLVMTNSIYRFTPGFGGPAFIPENSPALVPLWESNTPFAMPNLPQMTLRIKNRVQAIMLDGEHVIDYVQFSGPNRERNLNSEFQNNGTGPTFANIFSSALRSDNIPWGVDSQIEVSEGVDYGNSDQYWADKDDNTKRSEIMGFRSFMQSGGPLPISTAPLPGIGFSSASNSFATNLVVQVPFTPTFTVYDYTTWQANDPLVHYLTSDLNFSGNDRSIETGVNLLKLNTTNVTAPLPDLEQLNQRYRPWGFDMSFAGDENKFNLAYKDSLVSQSDNWNFPTNKLPSVGWLGRIHRGTPWQTVFLKATNILNWVDADTNLMAPGLRVWTNWTGDAIGFDATNATPVRDRWLFDLFTAAPNDNASRGQLPVNVGAGDSNPDGALAAWSAVFSGMIALSNNLDNQMVQFVQYGHLPDGTPFGMSYTNLTIEPAGVLGLNSAVGQLAASIYHTRTNIIYADGTKGVFKRIGDILVVPQLTEQSPFLNWNDSGQQAYGISDEMYEWLPQQAMSLLKVSKAPRYVIYCYGQALKPAQNGIVTSVLPGNSFFGLCTNYVPVAETAVRAVVRVEDANTTHPRIVVESYNILPPD